MPTVPDSSGNVRARGMLIGTLRLAKMLPSAKMNATDWITLSG